MHQLFSFDRSGITKLLQPERSIDVDVLEPTTIDPKDIVIGARIPLLCGGCGITKHEYEGEDTLARQIRDMYPDQHANLPDLYQFACTTCHSRSDYSAQQLNDVAIDLRRIPLS